MRLAIGSSLWLAITACSATDPGSGSGTLLVVADAFGKPDSTQLVVEVRKGAEPVRAASVEMEDVQRGRVHQLEEIGEGSQRRYESVIDEYVPILRLRIRSGNDLLEATLEGPTVHQITRPPDGARVARGSDEFLTVRWEAAAPAGGVTITPEGAPPLEVDGSQTSINVPLSGLQDGDQVLRVERSTETALAGGVDGSRMTVRYKVDNRFTLE